MKLPANTKDQQIINLAEGSAYHLRYVTKHVPELAQAYIDPLKYFNFIYKDELVPPESIHVEYSATENVPTNVPLYTGQIFNTGYTPLYIYRNYQMNNEITQTPIATIAGGTIMTVRLALGDAIVPKSTAYLISKTPNITFQDEQIDRNVARSVFFVTDITSDRFYVNISENNYITTLTEEYIQRLTALYNQLTGQLEDQLSDYDIRGYLPLGGGELVGQLKSSYGNVPVNFINIPVGSYRDIQATREDGNRVGVVRFQGNATVNSVSIGACGPNNSAPSGITISRSLDDGTVTVTGPTPPTSDSSNRLATTSYVRSIIPKAQVGSTDIPVYVDSNGVIKTTGKKFSDYVLKSGDTMSGGLIITRNINASGTADATVAGNQPALIVGGTPAAAHIEISANEVMAKSAKASDGTVKGAELHLNYDGGTVTVNKTNVVRLGSKDTAVGSTDIPVYVTAGGVVTTTGKKFSDYVPKTTTINGQSLSGNISLTAANVGALATTGGTVTGTIQSGTGNSIKRNVDNSYLGLFGDTSTDGKGSAVLVYGKSSTSNTGNVIIRAGDGTSTSSLILKPDGTMTWGGKSVTTTSASDVGSTDIPVYLKGGVITTTGKKFSDYVPITRTINSKALSANISLTASDVGAVPTTRTVNSKALSANISLTASDVGALATTGGTLTGGLTGTTATFSNTVTITRTTDASGTSDNKPALIVGGTSTQQHIEIDNNEIMSKASGTTVGSLYINSDGGNVYVNGKQVAVMTGDRGLFAGYETVGSATTINNASADANEVNTNVTLANSTDGTAYTKLVRFTVAGKTVTLGSKWNWVGGVAPTSIKAGSILVCCWCGSGGLCNILQP